MWSYGTKEWDTLVFQGYTNFPSLEVLKDCPTYQLLLKVAMIACLTQKHYAKKNMIMASRQNELLRITLCGPFKHTWLGGLKYFLILAYDFSRKMWIFFLLQKSEVFEMFKTMIKIIDRSKGNHIITFHSDKGGEFLSTTFNKFLEAKGIKW
jgi:hypothetical protein